MGEVKKMVCVMGEVKKNGLCDEGEVKKWFV